MPRSRPPTDQNVNLPRGEARGGRRDRSNIQFGLVDIRVGRRRGEAEELTQLTDSRLHCPFQIGTGEVRLIAPITTRSSAARGRVPHHHAAPAWHHEPVRWRRRPVFPQHQQRTLIGGWHINHKVKRLCRKFTDGCVEAPLAVHEERELTGRRHERFLIIVPSRSFPRAFGVVQDLPFGLKPAQSR